MLKFFSLLRAVMSQDMNLFRIKPNQKEGLSKALLPIILTALVMFSVGSMYYPMALVLKETNLTYIILLIAIIFPTMLLLIEGVYKSQSILFEAKDSELLFSLPISKKRILLAKLIKFYVFQLLYCTLFLLPAVIVYCIFEKVTVYFCVISLLFILLTPIVPTAIACFIGFLIKRFSVEFKYKKVVELIITFAIFIGFLALSSNISNIMESIVQNAEEFNESVTRIYFPAGAYAELIKGFNFVTLLKVLLLNIASVALFVLFASRTYFYVISKSKINISLGKKSESDVKELKFTSRKPILSLIKKEFSRYFSSMVYMFNTLFGLVLLVGATIMLCINFEGSLNAFSSDELSQSMINNFIHSAPKVFAVIIIALSFMTSITSSSISMERGSFNISKSLPVDTKTLLLAKILMSNILTVPVILLCSLIFFIFFNVSLIDIISIILIAFIAPSIAATFGLIVNLKFPKLDASSDTEIVKQSTSCMVAVLSGILLSSAFLALTFLLDVLTKYALLIEVVLLGLILLILWLVLKKYGEKRYREIEI